MAKLFVVLAAILAVCAASSIREKRQSYVNCGLNDGPVPDPEDCAFYFECYNGRGTRIACVRGLEFNPDNLQCDFPQNLRNPTCQRVPRGPTGGCDRLAPNSQTAHPEYCNAFMYCQLGYLLDGCTFCAEGEYFDSNSNRCVSTYNMDTNRVCNGRRMILPIEQPVRRLEGSCYPSNPTIYQALLRKIEGGRRFTTYRPITSFPG